MEDTEPNDISTRIEEYLTTNEAFQATNISVSDGRQQYNFNQDSASSYVTWYDKGVALGKLGKYEEAIKCYDKAIELNPNDAFAWYEKGYALDKLGKYEEAIKCYDKAIELNPNDAFAWNYKGVALDKLGKHKDAKKYYDRAKQPGYKFC